MYYVYVLKQSDSKIYVGYTQELKKRYRQHKEKQVQSTKHVQVELVYYEAYKSAKDARQRERKLKQRGNSKTRLKERIKQSLQEE